MLGPPGVRATNQLSEPICTIKQPLSDVLKRSPFLKWDAGDARGACDAYGVCVRDVHSRPVLPLQA